MHMLEKILNNTTPYGKIRASYEGSLHSSTLKLKFPVKYYLTEEKNVSPAARSVYRYHKSFKIIYTPYLRVWRHQYQKSAELCTWAKVAHRCTCMVSNKWKVTLERTCKPTGIMVYTSICAQSGYIFTVSRRKCINISQ